MSTGLPHHRARRPEVENDIVRGYHVGDRVMYVSLYDAHDLETPVTSLEDVFKRILIFFSLARKSSMCIRETIESLHGHVTFKSSMQMTLIGTFL